MVSGPIVYLRIIFVGPPKNFFNPVEMWSGIKLGLLTDSSDTDQGGQVYRQLVTWKDQVV